SEVAGLVEVEDAALAVEDADRVGHGVEQVAVALVLALGLVAQAAQFGQGLGEQRRVAPLAGGDQGFQPGHQGLVAVDDATLGGLRGCVGAVRVHAWLRSDRSPARAYTGPLTRSDPVRPVRRWPG